MPESLPKENDIPPVSIPVLTVLEGGPDSAEANHAEAAPTEGPALTVTEPEHINGNGVSHEEPNGHQHRIFWSDDETTRVANDLARLMVKQGLAHVPQVGDRFGRQMFKEMFYAAQLTALPRERRRLQVGIEQVKQKVWDCVELALKQKTYIQPDDVPVIIGAKTDATMNGGSLTPHEPATPPAAPMNPLAEVPTAALFSETFARLFAMLGEHEAGTRKLQGLEDGQLAIMDELGKDREETAKRFADLENKITIAAGQPKKALPRVALLGCQGYVMEHIKQGCETAGIRVEFRMYEQGSVVRGINADYALSLRFLDHATHKQVTDALPHDHYKFINGGVSMALAQLKEWFPPER